jgi:APA family basic amino acid/polyamine antiporter
MTRRARRFSGNLGESKKSETMERKASGLIRTYSGLDIMIFNMLFASAFVVPIFMYQFIGFSFPTVDQAFALAIGIIPGIVFGLLYIFWTAAFPRSGGDYVINSRVLGPTVGFIVSFVTLMAGLTFSAGWWSNLFTTFVTANLLGLLGGVTGQSGYTSLAFTWATPTYAFATGAVIIILCALMVSMIRPDRLNKIFLILALFGMFSMVLTAVLLFMTNQSSFAQAFNLFAQRSGVNDTNYYQTIVNSAPATPPVSFSITQTGFWAGGVVMAAWSIMWFVWGSSYVGGEIRQVKRSQALGVMGSVIATTVLSLLIVIPYYNSQGAAFSQNSIAAYFTGTWQLYPIQPMQYTSVMIMATTQPVWWTALAILINLGMYAWIITTVALLMTGASRTILAWSFDRLVPKRFGDVNPRYHQPHWAMLVIALLTMGFCGVYSYQATVFTALWSAFMIFTPIWFSVALSATLLPFLKKSWYETAGIAKYRLGPIPLISIFGMITMIVAGYGSYSFVTDPGWSWAGAGVTAVSLYLTVIIAGAILYVIARAFRARQKIAITDAYKELPIE